MKGSAPPNGMAEAEKAFSETKFSVLKSRSPITKSLKTIMGKMITFRKRSSSCFEDQSNAQLFSLEQD